MRLPLSSGIVLKLPGNNLILTLVFFRNSQDNGRTEEISLVLLWEWGMICIFVEVLYADFIWCFRAFFYEFISLQYLDYSNL